MLLVIPVSSTHLVNFLYKSGESSHNYHHGNIIYFCKWNHSRILNTSTTNDIRRTHLVTPSYWFQTTMYIWLLVNTKTNIKTPMLQCIFLINFRGKIDKPMTPSPFLRMSRAILIYTLIIEWVTFTSASDFFCFGFNPKKY